jgi:hypothetical protein
MDIHKLEEISSYAQKILILLFVIISIIHIVASQDGLQEIDIKINNLGGEVGGTKNIEGTISRSLPDSKFMWLFVCMNSTPTLGRPQGGNIEPSDGNWNQRAQIDPIGNAINQTFDIYVILVEADDNMNFNRNIDRYTYMPEDAIIKCKRTVKRVMPT